MNNITRFFEKFKFKYSIFFNYLDKNFEKFFFSTNHKDIGLYIYYFLL